MPGLSQPPPPTDAPVVDTAEQVYISSLALLKMLKHGRAGVPMEVMGLMLGELQKCLFEVIQELKIVQFLFR
jgi:26S proteasome regulatory subunit N11